MTALLSVSTALLAALLVTRIIKPLGLPDVTAYLLTGVALGPFCLGGLGIPGIGFADAAQLGSLSFISDAALGFIAFSIGTEFRLDSLKHTGRQAAVIGVFQALTATLFVDGSLLVLHLLLGEKLPVPVCITLGAIATATAPAATLMVVRQYKAKGPVTDILLPIVALDDAVGLIVFAVSFGIAKALVGGGANIVSIAVEPLIEIAASIILGALLGAALTLLERLFNSGSNRLSLSIGFVLLTVALSMLKFEIGGVHIGFSSLLVCMMLGTVFCNLCPLSADIMERSEKWTSPLFALFFVISGAELELDVFADIAIVGIGALYIVSRSAGKYIGARWSASLMKCNENIRRYLGITLLPQAGVALGMCVTAAELPEGGALIRNIILFSVLVYEIVGPMLTKLALTKAGDISPMSDEVRSRRRAKLEEMLKKRRDPIRK